MKKTAVLAIVLLCGMNVYGQEADAPLSRTVFKLSPQHFTQNALKAGIERFSETHAGSMAFFVTGRMDNKENLHYGDGYNGLAGEFQLRKYVTPMKTHTSRRNKQYHQGVYGSAYLQGGRYSGRFKGQSYTYYPNSPGYDVTPYDYKERLTTWGFGFTIGYQRTLWQVIFLEAFLGGGIQFSSSSVTGTTTDAVYSEYETITDLAYEGILPKMGIQIGIGL